MNVDTEKRCTKCGEIKPLSAFSKHKLHKDGLNTQCKACASIAHAKWRAEHQEERRACQAQYYLENREKLLARSIKYGAEHADEISARNAKYRVEHKEEVSARDARNYAKHREVRLAQGVRYHAKHREERAASHAKWYAENRERVAARGAMYYVENRGAKLAYQAKYQRENPQKVREFAHRRRSKEVGAVGVATADQIAARCELYGQTCYICGGDAEAIDHVIPLAAGGANWPANLRPICAKCNSIKGAIWPYDFAAARVDLGVIKCDPRESLLKGTTDTAGQYRPPPFCAPVG